MNALRALLAFMFVDVLVYTLITGPTHGWNPYPLFFGEITAMTWPGQFDLDFACFLLLAGIWIAWRHQFSPGGVALGLIGTLAGTLVVAPYMLFATYQADGDMAVFLLGKKRALE